MIKACITFYSSEKDQYGMPKKFNRYYIYVSPFEGDNLYSVASLISFSGSPVLDHPHLMLKGELEEALLEMVNKLRNLDNNKNLLESFYKFSAVDLF